VTGVAPGVGGGTTRWWERNRRAVVVAAVGWVWARCCIAAGFALAHLAGAADRPDSRLQQGLLAWDGAFYVTLADLWYGGATPDAARFFPLYPGVGAALAPLFGGREDIALVVVANACALLGAVLLWHLAREVLADPAGRSALPDDEAARVADRTAWMVALVPAALVLAFAYTEGPALALAAATLLAVQRRRWAWAGLWALGAAALRPVGGLLLVPIAIELWRCRPRPRPLPALAALAGPLVGFVAALGAIAAVTGAWTSAFDEQQPIRAGFRNPVVRSAEAVWALFNDNWTDVENVPFLVLWGLLVVVSVHRRQPWSWIALSAVTLAVATSAQTIDSLGRYGLLAVGLVVALAQWADARWRQVLVGVAGSAGLVWMTAEVLAGRVVP
jgi:hypothetical protein